MPAKERKPARLARGGKTGKKTGTMRSPRSGAEVPTGAHPGNTGGKKGRSGRKPAEWGAFCGDVLRDPATREAVRAAARDATGRGFAALIRLLAEDAGVKAPTPKQMQHVGRVEFVVRREGTDHHQPPRGS